MFSADVLMMRSFLVARTTRTVRLRRRPSAALATQARFQHGRLLFALVTQFQIIAPALGREFAFVQSFLHGTPWLAAMAAIGEAAVFGQRFDVGEQIQVFLAGELELPHAGGIDQATAT